MAISSHKELQILCRFKAIILPESKKESFNCKMEEFLPLWCWNLYGIKEKKTSLGEIKEVQSTSEKINTHSLRLNVTLVAVNSKYF